MIKLSELLLEKLGFKPFGDETVEKPKYLISNMFSREELSNSKDLPEANGIYMMFDGNKILYIGEGKNLQNRLGGHLFGWTDLVVKFGADVLGGGNIKDTTKKWNFILSSYNKENNNNPIEGKINSEKLEKIKSWLYSKGVENKLNNLKFRVIIAPSKGDAVKLEGDLIKQYQPELNKDQPTFTTISSPNQLSMFDKDIDKQVNQINKSISKEPTRDFRFKSLKEISRLQELAGLKK
jgi:hypothetical protein